MKKIKSNKLYITFLTVFLTIFLVHCQEKTQKHVVVIFASDGSKVLRAGKGIQLKRGMLLNKNDVIETGKGSVDLQTNSGASIRIQKFSIVKLATLGNHTSLDMKQGSLMAKVNRQKSSDTFQVKTPTLIAGVRGTTFAVDDDGVRVISGKVSLKPRIEALEAHKKADTLDKDLLELSKNMDKQEKIIEAGESGSLESPLLAFIEKTNIKINNNETLNVMSYDAVDDKITITQNDNKLRDKAEETTIVRISDDLFNKSIDNNYTFDSVLENEIAEQYNAKRDIALDILEKETLKDIVIENETDIKKHYSLIEKVYLHQNEKVYVGAVLAQAGGILVVHTLHGMFRVPVEKVSYIDYF